MTRTTSSRVQEPKKITVPAPTPTLAPRPQPWQEQLSLDLLLSVLERSILHPFIASLIPVCLLAVGHKPTSTSVIYTTSYFVALTSFQILLTLSRKYAYGPPRKVDIDDEVVVITGGLNGLGRCIADTYALRGVSTAVIDVGIKQEGEGESTEGWIGYTCDVGNKEDVERVWQRITKEVGTPTVLINNAGVVDGRLLRDLSMDEIENVYRVNAISHHHLVSLFLPPLLTSERGGHVVTVSSALGYLGASRLSTYAASKAALLAFHSSLTSELAAIAPQIKTILVTPGQLDTDLFAGLRPNRWQRFLGPIVEVKDLAVRIVSMIDGGEAGAISMPAYAQWAPISDVVPVGIRKLLRKIAGIDLAMTEAMVIAREKRGEVGNGVNTSKRKDL